MVHIKCGYKRCILDIEVTGDVWIGSLACVGVMNLESKNKEIQCFTGESEELVLKTFLHYFNKSGFNQIIGFNIIGWDIRFLLAKCMKYRLQAKAIYQAKCIDLMLKLKTFDKGDSRNNYGSLHQWSRFLGGSGKLAKEASIHTLYEMHRWDELILYNQTDLRITHDIWERLNEVIGCEK